MRRTTIAAFVAVLVTVLAGAIPSGAVVDTWYMTYLPGSQFSSDPPVSVTEEGSQLIYINADAALHDVVSEDPHPIQCPDTPGICPDATPQWCLPPDPDQPYTKFPDASNLLPYSAGDCPLFVTPLIGTGEQAEVRGASDLIGGEIYVYLCRIHTAMEARLLVLPKVA